jgi:F0F1-type ATP synthase epsilon subunit
MSKLMRRSMSGSAAAGSDGGQETTSGRHIARIVADEAPAVGEMSEEEAAAELTEVESRLYAASAEHENLVARATLVRARLLSLGWKGYGQ